MKVLNLPTFVPKSVYRSYIFLAMSGCGLFFYLVAQPTAPRSKENSIEKQFLRWSEGLTPRLSCSRLNVHPSSSPVKDEGIQPGCSILTLAVIVHFSAKAYCNGVSQIDGA